MSEVDVHFEPATLVVDGDMSRVVVVHECVCGRKYGTRYSNCAEVRECWSECASLTGLDARNSRRVELTFVLPRAERHRVVDQELQELHIFS